MAPKPEAKNEWQERLLFALPHIFTVSSIALGVAWWGGKLEQRIDVLEREQEREMVRQAAFKADVQRELNTINQTTQSVDGKVTTLVMTLRAGDVRR